MHIYATFGILMLVVTVGIQWLLAAARADADLSTTLLYVIGTASGITLMVALGAFFIAWKVRGALD